MLGYEYTKYPIDHIGIGVTFYWCSYRGVNITGMALKKYIQNTLLVESYLIKPPINKTYDAEEKYQ